MYIIIDGYNIIRQSDTLKQLERISLEEGRKELLRRITEYRKSKKHKITVVFDGWLQGSFKEERSKENGITIVYSKQGETADEVIARLATGRQEEIIVVTSDRALGNVVSRTGCTVIASHEFEARMMSEMYNSLLAEKFLNNEEEYASRQTKKKGTAKKLSKRKRLIQKKLQKL